ncbi:MAG: OmpA family protein, partial [Bacteroidetes bacterium]|nr:OmpA family protein [Bacteroidota bacterium]
TFLKANNLYESLAYAEAIPKYVSVLNKDSTVTDALIKLADCYRLTNDVENAEKSYALIIKKGIGKPIHQFYYAQALMSSGKYAEAEKNMAAYRADERGETFAKAIDHINKFFKDSAYYKIKRESFNSKQNDFSPALWNDEIVFTSSRTRANLVDYKYSWTENNFFKIYTTSKDTNGEYKRVHRFAPRLQKKYNDGPLCFSNDGKTIYFTRNNINGSKSEKSSDGKVNLQLYKAIINKKGNGYEYPSAFEYNNKEFNFAHPAINSNGSRLYFSSDMPGGAGGMDLWMCNKEGDFWGKPQNLGNLVNTKSNDVFPTVSGNILYFSSNGLEGIGGLDIFWVLLDSNGLPKGNVVNFGVPMNSPADDFGISFNKDEKSGYLSSNRKTLNMDDDIYSFVVNKPPKQPYKILVEDSISGNLLISDISIKNIQSGEMTGLKDSSGTYIPELFPDNNYAIDANSKDYHSKSGIAYSPASDANPFEIKLTKIKVYVCFGFVYEKGGTQPPIDSALVIITDDKGEKVCEQYFTDINGKYIACTLKPSVEYTVTASKRGYFTNSITFNTLPADGRLENIYLDKIVIGKAIKIENIYFDYDKYNIRPDAAVELDKIVKVLKENPDIIIELGSHTDCRGPAIYNIWLSDCRAKSSAAYIVSMGIDSTRITGKGYGETQLVNDCKCEGYFVSKCTEQEHQMNRRTEFKVTGYVKGIGEVKIDSKQ